MKTPETLLATVRQALGCRQEEMAAYLDITRALLSNVEISNRALPAKAGLKLLSLHQLIQQIPSPNLQGVEGAVSSHQIDNYVFKLKQQLEQQRKKWQTLTDNRELALAALRNIVWIRENTAAENEALILLLNLLQAETKVKLGNYSKEKLALAALKLKALEAACLSIAEV